MFATRLFNGSAFSPEDITILIRLTRIQYVHLVS